MFMAWKCLIYGLELPNKTMSQGKHASVATFSSRFESTKPRACLFLGSAHIIQLDVSEQLNFRLSGHRSRTKLRTAELGS